MHTEVHQLCEAHALAWPAMKHHLIDVARSCFSNTQDNLDVVAYLVNEAKYSEIYFMYHGHASPSGKDFETSNLDCDQNAELAEAITQK